MSMSEANAGEVQQMSRAVDGHRLRYLVHSPPGKPPAGGWPLIVFLHGYGECGDDIQVVKKHGPPKLAGKSPALSQCVVISPQCPRNSWWRVAAVKTLVDEFVAGRSDLDRRRMYLTGLSMGGYGTWSFISHYPDYFAAAIPICGGGDPFRLPANRPPRKTGIKNEFDPQGLTAAKDLPIWTFHGSKDTSVPIAETQMLVDSLQAAGSKNIQFTTYADAGHVKSWQIAYGDENVWKWLFDQKRSE